ncbi:MAG: hypothetical protein FGM15_11900 [Chthoniobacterales bacterium]|nr:hypothetical protein [Chthoniobacterales bacterium]
MTGEQAIYDVLTDLASYSVAALGLVAAVLVVKVGLKWAQGLSAISSGFDEDDHRTNDMNDWENDRAEKYGGFRDINN